MSVRDVVEVSPRWGDAAQAMFRAAQAVSHPGGPGLFDDLVRELADMLGSATVFIAVFSDDARTQLRTLAAVLDGKRLANFDYPLEGSPCARVVGQSFRYVASGVAVEFRPGTLFAAKGMDSYAAFPLNDSAGAPLGLLVAMGRKPVADATLAEALLKIFAGRIVGEIERSRADQALRTAALAVSSAHGDTVFAELVRYLAAVLRVDVAFIASHEPEQVPDMHTLAVAVDGRVESGARYALATSPCASVLDHGFRVWPERLRESFPDDGDAVALSLEGYAGFPIADSRGRPLGTIGVASRRPLTQLERIESMLQIFAVRAGAELERLRATEALRRSEASYRAIFEAAEDAIFVHDWDTGEILDVNPKACETYGYTRDELKRLSVAEVSSGVPPYTAGEALQHLQQAKLGRCPPFEWHRRNKDGTLRWDEVRLKPAQIDGRPHILAFTRDITEQKAALEALQSREEQYRAIFETASDAFVLWDEQLTVIDANPAALQLYGYRREDVIGRGFPDHLPPAYRQERLDWVRRAMAGETVQVETTATRARGDGTSFDIELRVVPFRHRGKPLALAVGRDITERKAADAMLRASEEQYRAIFRASADALILWDSQYRRVDVNPAYERMFGWDREDVLGRGWDRPADGDEYAAPRRELVRRALAGETCRAELASRRKDGEIIQIEVHATPFRHRGEPHVLAIARDITERRRAEERLRAREEQYRAIFDGSVDPMVLWNRALQVVDVNAAFEQTTGLRRDEVVGRHWSERPDAKEMGRLLPIIERALAGELTHTVESVTRADGSPFDIELRYLPVRLGGEPFALGIGRDVTARLEQERAVERSEARLRATVEAAFDCVIGMDGEGRIVEWNGAAERCFAHRRDDVLGRSFAEVIVPKRHHETHARMLQTFRPSGGSPMVGRLIETTALRADGIEIPVELAISVAAVPEGSIFVCHVRDISERRAAEAERAALESQLRQAQKMEAIGQLTGGIAHDFNNILTSVLGYLVLGEERARKLADSTLVRQLGQAQLAAQRARELIAQMLAFARRQRGERRAVALSRLVRQSLQLLRPSLPASIVLDTIELEALEDAALPPVHADAVQLEQVLFNLCINARDAMEGAGHIRVGLGETGGAGLRCTSCGNSIATQRWVELSVADSGSGIAPEVLQRMFEPFFTTKEVGRGSGMGLAMVHGIVHEHGGHVVVDSVPGRGTVFRVLVPAADGQAVEPHSPLDVGSTEAPRLRGSVLLVEDEAMVGDFMVELLGGWGLDVALLRDPLAAREWLEDEANHVDLLITDQTMPQMTGLELARRCRDIRPALPVLIYTGNAETLEAQALERHGVRALLRKPVESEALRTALRTCLGPGAQAQG